MKSSRCPDPVAKMPTLVIYTNVLGKDFPENWHKEMTELVSKLLGKPEKVRHAFRARGLALGRPRPLSAPPIDDETREKRRGGGGGF